MRGEGGVMHLAAKPDRGGTTVAGWDTDELMS